MLYFLWIITNSHYSNEYRPFILLKVLYLKRKCPLSIFQLFFTFMCHHMSWNSKQIWLNCFLISPLLCTTLMTFLLNTINCINICLKRFSIGYSRALHVYRQICMFYVSSCNSKYILTEMERCTVRF